MERTSKTKANLFVGMLYVRDETQQLRLSMSLIVIIMYLFIIYFSSISIKVFKMS